MTANQLKTHLLPFFSSCCFPGNVSKHLLRGFQGKIVFKNFMTKSYLTYFWQGCLNFVQVVIIRTNNCLLTQDNSNSLGLGLILKQAFQYKINKAFFIIPSGQIVLMKHLIIVLRNENFQLVIESEDCKFLAFLKLRSALLPVWYAFVV